MNKACPVDHFQDSQEFVAKVQHAQLVDLPFVQGIEVTREATARLLCNVEELLFVLCRLFFGGLFSRALVVVIRYNCTYAAPIVVSITVLLKSDGLLGERLINPNLDDLGNIHPRLLEHSLVLMMTVPLQLIFFVLSHQIDIPLRCSQLLQDADLFLY